MHRSCNGSLYPPFDSAQGRLLRKPRRVGHPSPTLHNPTLRKPRRVGHPPALGACTHPSAPLRAGSFENRVGWGSRRQRYTSPPNENRVEWGTRPLGVTVVGKFRHAYSPPHFGALILRRATSSRLPCTARICVLAAASNSATRFSRSLRTARYTKDQSARGRRRKNPLCRARRACVPARQCCRCTILCGGRSLT